MRESLLTPARPSLCGQKPRKVTQWQIISILSIVVALAIGISQAQTKKALTNDDVIQMVKAGFEQSMIVKAIEANETNFDVSVQALMDLKNAGVNQPIIEAMLDAEAKKKAPSPTSISARESIAPSAEVPQLKRERPDEGQGPVLPAIYVEEVSSSGGIVASSDTALEAIKTLQEKGVRVVTIKDKADYVLQITRQLGKKSWRKDTKVVLSNREGEVVFTHSTRSVGGAMGDVADFIRKRHE